MKFSEEDVKAALSAITEGNERVSEVSKKYNIPVAFLEHSLTEFRRHVAVDTTVEKQYDEAMLGIFNKDQENELNEIIMNLGTHFCGISESDVRRIVYEYAETNNIGHNFDTRNRQTGEIWYLEFIRSYPGLNYVIRETKNESTLHQESICDSSPENSYRSNPVIEKFLHDYGCKQNSLMFEKSEVNLDMSDQKEIVLNPPTNHSEPLQISTDNIENTSVKKVEDSVDRNPDIIHEKNSTREKEILAAIEDTVNQNHGIIREENSFDEKKILATVDNTINTTDEKPILPLCFDEDSNLVPTINGNDIPYLDKTVCMDLKKMNRADHRRNIAEYFANPDDLSLDESISDVPVENCEEIPHPLANEKFEAELSNDTEVSNYLDPSTVNAIMQITETLTKNEENTTSNLPENAALNTENCLNHVINFDSIVSDNEEKEEYLESNTSPETKIATISENPSKDNQDNFESSSLESGSYVSCMSPSHDEIVTSNTDIVSKYDDCWTGVKNPTDQTTFEGNIEMNKTFSKEFKTVPTADVITASSATNTDSQKIEENIIEASILNRNEQNFSLISNLQNNVDSTDLSMFSVGKGGDFTVTEENSNDGSNNIAKKSLDDTNDVSEIMKHNENICQDIGTDNVDSRLTDNDSTPDHQVVESSVKNSSNFNISPSNDDLANPPSFTDMPETTLTVNHTTQSDLPKRKPKSKRKIAEASTDEGAHVSRKKMKTLSKTKNRKTVSTSRGNKPKKSVYLYKLKSYSGSELHFTSPTSVTFIKPVIKLTKLDESKYVNLRSEELQLPGEEPPPPEEEPPPPEEKPPPPEEKPPPPEEEPPPLEQKPLVENKPAEIPREPCPENTKEKVQLPVKQEPKVDEKFDQTKENSTPTFSMQTRKKRLKFLPDGTLVTPKLEPNDETVSPSPRIKNTRKRALKGASSSTNSTPNTDKKNKSSPDDNDRLKPSPAESKNAESRIKKADKYVPATNCHFKKPQKIFDYEGYYREKSNMGDTKKILLPAPPKKQTVALSRVKSISQSAKSGQLVVNPAQLLSCLLGTPITQDQIRTVRFKPSNKQRVPNNQVKVTSSKLANDSDGIKPVAKRQLELLQNTPLNIFPNKNSQASDEPSHTLSQSESN